MDNRRAEDSLPNANFQTYATMNENLHSESERNSQEAIETDLQETDTINHIDVSSDESDEVISWVTPSDLYLDAATQQFRTPASVPRPKNVSLFDLYQSINQDSIGNGEANLSSSRDDNIRILMWRAGENFRNQLENRAEEETEGAAFVSSNYYVPTTSPHNCQHVHAHAHPNVYACPQTMNPIMPPAVPSSLAFQPIAHNPYGYTPYVNAASIQHPTTFQLHHHHHHHHHHHLHYVQGGPLQTTTLQSNIYAATPRLDTAPTSAHIFPITNMICPYTTVALTTPVDHIHTHNTTMSGKNPTEFAHQ